jgi:hypothetical protein
VDESEQEKRRRREREANARLPAGLEDSGRDEQLVTGAEAHPSGTPPDHRQGPPGTRIAGAPHAAAERDSDEDDET